MITAKQTHCGQYKRYGDFFRVWEIETDESEEAVREYCFTEIYKRKDLPAEATWRAAIRHPDGEHRNDPSYYFRGYYKLTKTEAGYTFTVCEPYAE